MTLMSVSGFLPSSEHEKSSCPNATAHHEPGIPDGYIQRAEWFDWMALSHDQKQCPVCQLWCIWVPREEWSPYPYGRYSPTRARYSLGDTVMVTVGRYTGQIHKIVERTLVQGLTCEAMNGWFYTTRDGRYFREDDLRPA